MKTAFAKQLKSARLIKGYSLEAVAQLLQPKMTRQALHKYETGEVLPSGDFLIQVSNLFNLPADFFFRENELSVGEIQYRKKVHLSKKELYQLIEQIKDYGARVLETRMFANKEELRFNRLVIDQAIQLSQSEISKIAEQLRALWGVGTAPIINVLALLERQGVLVVPIDAPIHFDGLQTTIDETIPVIAFNKSLLNQNDRLRFTVLHELAHYLFAKQFQENLSEKQIERYCNDFAGAFLLPDAAIIELLGKERSSIALIELARIKRNYGISISSIMMRALAVGIVSKEYVATFFEQFKKQGFYRTEPVDYTGTEELMFLNQHLVREVIEGEISMQKAASLANVSLIEFRQYMNMR